mmetsp:Transcript_25350/g.60191  ORF Transcript_25350/g.60191 Transcript_25350/m.60191 type:complete len:409 (-) Transcript_25350:231-1457(-)
MAASAIKSVNMGELLTWVEQYAAENPSPKAGAGQIDACVIRDIVQSCVIQPFQVLWVEEGEVRHREFYKDEEAAKFYNELSLEHCKRMTRKGAEVCRHTPGRREWPLEWVPDHPSAYQHMSNFFQESELAALGDMSRRTRVKFDHRMQLCCHGTSLRCEHTRVPLCVVNPSTPDRRYVILHEMMHHQLDHLGSPCLACPQICSERDGSVTFGGVKAPKGHWMELVNCQVDPHFVGNCVRHLWELIQHSRFNPFIQRAFTCSPAPARDGEYAALIEGRALYSYCNADTDPHPLRRIMMAVHLATVHLECSAAMQARVKASLEREGERGRDILELGRAIDANIHRPDLQVCELGEEDAEAMTGGMLMDLEKVLQLLVGSGFRLEVANLRSLPTMHNHRSRTVADILVHPA